MGSKTKTVATKEEAKPALVPKLRFPEFRGEEWDKKKIGSMLIETPRPIDLEDATEYNLVTVKRRYGGLVSRGKLKGREIKVNTQFLVHKGDFLISKRQIVHDACGLVPETLDGAVVSNEYSVLTPKAGCSVEYINWFAQQPCVSRSFLQCSVGIVIEKMLFKLEAWLKWEFLFPGLPEQQKIAECLSSVDDLMAAQARKVDALKTHKKGLMQQLFPREGETQPRLRFPEFQNAGEWEVRELGSLSDVRDGTHDSPAFFLTGRPLVTSKNLQPDGTLDLENVSLISDEDYEQINKRSKVTVGDILFGMIGTIGNPVLIKSEGFAIKNVALIKELGPLSNEFLVQLLQSGYVTAIFAVLNTGNSQKFIALGKIRGLPVPVPSPAEQQRIASCLSSLDALISAETQKLEALKTHKKGLMQQLFPSPEAVEA